MGSGSDAGWRLGVYVAAGEAAGTFRYSWTAPRGPSSGRSDPDRSAAEAARRARTALRRYCAANGLNRSGTLTYRGEGCHDPRQVRADLGAFFRRLRRSLDGERFAYAWAPEWHKTDHGLHAHFAVGRYIGRQLIEDAWGHGFIKIRQITDLPVGSGRLDEARIAGRYLGKYAGKDFNRERLKGLHRYEVAQGFQPVAQLVEGRTRDEALAAACDLQGGHPRRVWDSSESEDWQGPPAVWASW